MLLQKSCMLGNEKKELVRLYHRTQNGKRKNFGCSRGSRVIVCLRLARVFVITRVPSGGHQAW